MKHLKRKRALVLLVVCSLVLYLLAGCASSSNNSAATTNDAPKTEETAKEPAKAATDGGVVTVKMATSGSTQEMDIRTNTGNLFTEENPNIKIEWIDLGADRVQKTLTLISSGEAPDIHYMNEQVYAFAVKGVLLPLDSLVERDGFDRNNFYDSLLKVNTYDGALYAFPQEVSPFVMYYNKDLFEAAGVPLPTDNWTQEDFYNAAKKLTNPAEKVYGYQHYSGWADQDLGWMVRAGASIYNSDLTKVAFDSPEALEGLKFIEQIVRIDKISPDAAEAQAMGKNFDALFRNQKVAMNSAGLWMLPQYRADPLPFNWDVVKMPKNKNQLTKAGVLNWGIDNKSKNVDAAWEVLKYFVGPVGMKLVAESNMALPGNKDAVANKIVADSGFPANVKAFIDSAADVTLEDAMSPFKVELMTAMCAEIDLMNLGQQSAEDTQKNIVEKLNAIMAE